MISKDNMVPIYIYDAETNNIKSMDGYYFDKDYNIYSFRRNTPFKISIRTYDSCKAKPNVIMRDNNKHAYVSCALEDMIIGTYFIKPEIDKNESTILDNFKKGYGIIYKDDNCSNYMPENLNIVNIVRYLKWCKDNGIRPNLTEQRENIIRLYAKKTNNCGYGKDAYTLVDKFNLSYRTIRRIMLPVTGKRWGVS